MIEKLIENSRGNITPAAPRDVTSNVADNVKCPSFVQGGVFFILKISAGNITYPLPN